MIHTRALLKNDLLHAKAGGTLAEANSPQLSLHHTKIMK